MIGDKVTFENLSISFIVDEYLENYTELHNWLIGIGFPKNRTQFSTFRSSTSNTSSGGTGGNNDIGVVGNPVADKPFYSDATLSILSNKNNPIVNVLFRDLYPVAMSALEYNQAATDVEYLSASVDIAYQIYDIKAI